MINVFPERQIQMKKFFVQPLYNLFRKLIRNPKYRWLVLAGSLIYLISPLDISPDVFPIVGWLDDGVIVTLLVSEVSQILLDRRNAQKNKQPSSVASTTSEFDSAANTTIDVKATV